MRGKTLARWIRVALLLAAAGPVQGLAQQTAPGPSASADQVVCVEESARLALAHGAFREAEEQLRRTILTVPACPEAHFLLAYSLFRQNLPQASLAEYTAAARLRDPTPSDLRNVALDYVLLDDYSDADHWIRRSLQMDPDDSESWYSLGRICYSRGKFQDSADAFKHALAIEPESLKAENNLGLAYEGLNEVDKAEGAYRKAISFGEKSGRPNEQPMINLASLLEHQSALEEARDLLAHAVVLAPGDARAHEHLGRVSLDLNMLPQAQAELEKAVSLSPSDARLHYLLGQTYRRRGLNDKASIEFARSASLNGTHSTPDYVK